MKVYIVKREENVLGVGLTNRDSIKICVDNFKKTSEYYKKNKEYDVLQVEHIDTEHEKTYEPYKKENNIEYKYIYIHGEEGDVLDSYCIEEHELNNSFDTNKEKEMPQVKKRKTKKMQE